ncbi:hypothetical protein [Polaromonas sp.]|uniref:hypothetical protein n=1 Tax=Polaromonas sp. TaxID=1869339 RepID=UPI003FA76747
MPRSFAALRMPAASGPSGNGPFFATFFIAAYTHSARAEGHFHTEARRVSGKSALNRSQAIIFGEYLPSLFSKLSAVPAVRHWSDGSFPGMMVFTKCLQACDSRMATLIPSIGTCVSRMTSGEKRLAERLERVLEKL